MLKSIGSQSIGQDLMTEQQQLNEWINGYAYILGYGWNALKYSKQYFNIGFQICLLSFQLNFFSIIVL